MKTFAVNYNGKSYDLRYLFILNEKIDLIKIDLRGTELSEIAGGILEIRRRNHPSELLTWPDRLTIPDDFKTAIHSAILSVHEGPRSRASIQE